VALTLAPFETPQDAVQALLDNATVDALLVDNVSLRQAQGRGAAIEGVGAPLESNPYVVVAPSRASDLQKRVEATLAKFGQDGILDELEHKWFRQQ
jgi:ABC-type amino acid transport substrate-binding protein